MLFKAYIKLDALFVDKSLFIERLLKDGDIVNLFLIPRRFGKSLNLSILKYFFDIKDVTKNKELFKGLNKKLLYLVTKNLILNDDGVYVEEIK